MTPEERALLGYDENGNLAPKVGFGLVFGCALLGYDEDSNPDFLLALAQTLSPNPNANHASNPAQNSERS